MVPYFRVSLSLCRPFHKRPSIDVNYESAPIFSLYKVQSIHELSEQIHQPLANWIIQSSISHAYECPILFQHDPVYRRFVALYEHNHHRWRRLFNGGFNILLYGFKPVWILRNDLPVRFQISSFSYAPK